MHADTTHIPPLHARTGCSATFGMVLGCVLVWITLELPVPPVSMLVLAIVLAGATRRLRPELSV
jgi:hypothetical protein